MTHSQSIAKVFTYVGYILLIPAILGTAISLLTVYLAIIPIAISSVGIYLLMGYRKHGKGELNEGKIISLWVKTAIFNFVLLVPSILVAYQNESIHTINEWLTGNIAARLYFSIVMWQLMAVLLSISAVADELRSNQNIGNVP